LSPLAPVASAATDVTDLSRARCDNTTNDQQLESPLWCLYVQRLGVHAASWTLMGFDCD